MAAMQITNENFHESVVNAEQKVLLDFWAPWCGPCRMVSPVIDQIAREHPDIKVGKINVDEQPELANRFQVFSIPTLLVMENGQVVSQNVGARPKHEILAML